MWYRGSAVIRIIWPLASRSDGPIHASDCSTFEARLRWVSIAPFDTPVVPPVYCRNAMSSWPSGTGTRFSNLPLPSASTKPTAPGSEYSGTCFFTWRSTKFASRPFGNPSRSPMPVTITVSTPVSPITCCSVCAKFSKITMAFAPESFSWCSSSRGVYSGLVFTTVRPARNAAVIATGYCSTFGSMIAMRSPLRRPATCCR